MTASVYLGSQSYVVPINPQNITSIAGGVSLEVPGKNGATVFRFSESLAKRLPNAPLLVAIEGELILEVSIDEDCFAQGSEIVMVRSFDLFDEVAEDQTPEVAIPSYSPDPAQPHLI
jgi:hypothetical protein